VIPSKILNINKTDYESSPVFLGEQDQGLFDTIHKNHPAIWNYYKEIRSLDWSEDEFDFSSCNLMFKQCPEDIKDKMIKTLAWQWEADTVASRQLFTILAPFVSSDEMTAYLLRVCENEVVHAATYSEIVRMSFDKPEEVLQEILEINESLQRLETVCKVFEETRVKGLKYSLGELENNQELYNTVFKFCVTMYALESIQFMSSFAITFSICEAGMFPPIGKAVQKIAQDEYEVHKEFWKDLVKQEVKTERGGIALGQCKDELEAILNEIVDSELLWLKEGMFTDGKELAGVNEDLCGKWTLFNAKAVYRLLGIKSKYTMPAKNPLKFMEHWLDISKTQPAPQEEDVAAYKVGMIKRTDEGTLFDIEF
jgi:ribonucleoside-diphosphate reductase beta chain